MKRKVVINDCYGGFELSPLAEKRLCELKGFTPGIGSDYIPRHDPDLIQVVEELGPKANGDCAKLKIIDIGEEKYHINEYDGYETVILQSEEGYWL